MQWVGLGVCAVGGARGVCSGWGQGCVQWVGSGVCAVGGVRGVCSGWGQGCAVSGVRGVQWVGSEWWNSPFLPCRAGTQCVVHNTCFEELSSLQSLSHLLLAPVRLKWLVKASPHYKHRTRG